MRWKGRERSENIDDRRRMSPGGVVAGGGIGMVLLAVVVMLLGGDPSQLLSQGGATGPGQSVDRPLSPEEKEQEEFVAVVLKDTEDVWNELFRERGQQYQEPKLVLFSGRVQSACGMASAAVGPFYCPADDDIYIDLQFFQELETRFGAKGEFARAYVIAHEVGHHVQNQMGISDKVHAARKQLSEREYNQLSVRLELQADYFAGVWAHHAQRTKGVLNRADIESAISAASAIGDDKLQMESQGHVVPDAFTHGTSEQRIRWFLKGWESGRMEDGDTFSAKRL